MCLEKILITILILQIKQLRLREVSGLSSHSHCVADQTNELRFPHPKFQILLHIAVRKPQSNLQKQ